MTHRTTMTSRTEPSPRLWRMFVVGLCTLILCACQAPRTAPTLDRHPTGLPPEAYTAAPPAMGAACADNPHMAGIRPAGDPQLDPGFAASGLVVPPAVRGPWVPPGIAEPWPEDEYLLDGGDRGLPAGVSGDWEVRGLEPEDTIAHFDTIDGETVVTPSNRVRIYSPRFGSVRQVASIIQNEQWNHTAGMYTPTRLVHCNENDTPAQSKQNLQLNRQLSKNVASTFRSEQLKGVMSTAVGPESFQDAFLAYENVQVIRCGQFKESEMAFLAQGVTAAVTWNRKQSVQIILEREGAMEVTEDESLESVFTVKSPPGRPKLRVIKVASTQFAEPGDTVDFTLRFDNLGNEPIGNVTVIDNLTTRLEYIPDSAQCSLKAEFSTQANAAQSLALRWEIKDPLPPNKGGIIRFRCTVR